jgi:hypothetical protein
MVSLITQPRRTARAGEGLRKVDRSDLLAPDPEVVVATCSTHVRLPARIEQTWTTTRSVSPRTLLQVVR